MATTREIQRAEYLVGRLHKAIARAKAFKEGKAKRDLPEALELIDLLADSIRTAKAFDLVEFDGTIEPEADLRGNMISRPCLEDYRASTEDPSERFLAAWKAKYGGE